MAEKTEPNELPQAQQVICTLYEGDYHLGVAALLNSLLRGGFKGLFWIGNRGDLPPWTAQLKRRPDGLFEVGQALLGFETLQTERHFGQYKSEFLSSIVDRGITQKYLWYFDPDITVQCEWSFFEAWVRYGICLCQDDGYGFMPASHPLRLAWAELARAADWGEPLHTYDRYFNSGFIGIDVAHRGFLTQWRTAVALARESGVQANQFQKGSRAQTFFTVDQDTMNMAAMYSDAPFSLMGPEGMGFYHGGFTMHHSITSPKPWRKQFLRRWLKGATPTKADQHFLECADGPIQPYTGAQLRRLRRSARLASLLGRFYRLPPAS